MTSIDHSDLPDVPEAAGHAAPSAPSGGGTATVTKDDVTEAMKDVVDPELGINVVDLGLVYGIDVDTEANVAILDMTLTSAACPLTDVIEDQARQALTGGQLIEQRDQRPAPFQGPALSLRGVGGRGVLVQTRKPRARSCSRPSSVILSGPHGGIQTQLIATSLTRPSRAALVWSWMTSVSGQAAEVSVMSMTRLEPSSRCRS